MLSLLCAKYAPTTADERDLAGGHFCMASGLLLLSVDLVAESVPQSSAERAVQVKFGGAKYSVELFGGKFEAFDAGHVIVDEAGVEHENQCVLCGYSLSSTSYRKACSRTCRCGTHGELASLRVFATKRKWRLSGSGPSPGTCLWRLPSCEPTSEIC